MSLKDDILKRLKQPEPIYSRNEAKLDLKGLLAPNENIVFGLEKRDSYLKTYRTRWFLTETKIVIIRTTFPLNRTREIFLFDEVSEMRLFEDEGVLVISTLNGEDGFEATSSLEQEFAKQAIEQYNRFQEALNSSSTTTEDETDDSDSEAADESDDE